MKKKLEIEKVYFKLFIDALKLSDDYKKFCDFAKAKKKNPALRVPEELRHFLGIYCLFRSIHDKKWTFEKWWQHRKKLISELGGMPLDSFISRKILSVTEPYHMKPLVTDYAEVFSEDIKWCMQQMNFNRKEESLTNFIEYLTSYLREGTFLGSDHITIRIYHQGKTIEEIMPLLQAHLKKQMNSPKVKFAIRRSRRYINLMTLHKRLEIEKYLKAYALEKKDLKPSEIAKQLFPNEDPSQDCIQ